MTDVLAEMKAYAEQERLPILRDGELPLLEKIVCQAAPRAILEVGTCIGYSALHMAPYLAPDGTLTTIEVDADRHERARRYIARTPYRDAITLLLGDATVLLETLAGPWDIVFLDGPKGQYLRQLELIEPKLVPGAIVVADNVRYHDKVFVTGVVPHKHRTAVYRLRAFMDVLHDDRLFETVCFENGDGLTVSRWKG